MRYVSALSVVGLLALPVASFAAPAQAKETWATGQIERVDTASKSIVVKQGTHEMTFVLASNAAVMQGKKAVQAADLLSDVGRQVKVRYTVKAGSKIADRIEVSEMASTASAKPPAKMPAKPPVKR